MHPTELYFRTPWDAPLVKPLSVSAGPILITSQEAQQRRPLPCSGALWHRCVFIPVFPLSPSAFLPVCLREHPFFKLASCLRSLSSTTNATGLLHNLLGFSYLFDSFSPEYLPSRNIQRVLIIFTRKRLGSTNSISFYWCYVTYIRPLLMSFNRLHVTLSYVSSLK